MMEPDSDAIEPIAEFRDGEVHPAELPPVSVERAMLAAGLSGDPFEIANSVLQHIDTPAPTDPVLIEIAEIRSRLTQLEGFQKRVIDCVNDLADCFNAIDEKVSKNGP